MNIQLKKLPLQELEWKESPFHISSLLPPAPLKLSIEKNGLLSPLAAVSVKNTLYLIDGFKRCTILEILDQTPVPCLLYEVDSMEKAVALFIKQSLTEEKQGAMVKAKILHLVKKHAPDLPAEIINTLKLPRKQADLEILFFLPSLPVEIQLYLESIDIRLSGLRSIGRLQENATAKLLLETGLSLSLNSNQLRKLLDQCGDLEKRDINIPHLMAAVLEADMEARELRQQLFDLLEKTRLPNFSKHLTNFQEKKEAVLPKEIQVGHANFEGDLLSFSFKAANSEQAASRAQNIITAHKEDRLQTLFRFLSS